VPCLEQASTLAPMGPGLLAVILLDRVSGKLWASAMEKAQSSFLRRGQDSPTLAHTMLGK
jgi:hypothetical protein